MTTLDGHTDDIIGPRLRGPTGTDRHRTGAFSLTQPVTRWVFELSKKEGAEREKRELVWGPVGGPIWCLR